MVEWNAQRFCAATPYRSPKSKMVTLGHSKLRLRWFLQSMGMQVVIIECARRNRGVEGAVQHGEK